MELKLQYRGSWGLELAVDEADNEGPMFWITRSLKSSNSFPRPIC